MSIYIRVCLNYGSTRDPTRGYAVHRHTHDGWVYSVLAASADLRGPMIYPTSLWLLPIVKLVIICSMSKRPDLKVPGTAMGTGLPPH